MRLWANRGAAFGMAWLESRADIGGWLDAQKNKKSQALGLAFLLRLELAAYFFSSNL
jgi:hypothetical protein